ncbi:Hypothetical predicted protein [Pelobates cultripes]|uniref:Uncharacterized protein n=1 Tax=Pelobates cultripes TaxID=61616 RepID=A0AAD1RHX4_PELCU|nr:Hypothetical predicted protein [Pelobates cultripes]
MGRSRRTEPSQTPRGSQQHPSQGLMDPFLQPTSGAGGETAGPASTPPSPASSSGAEHSSLDRIGEEIRSIAASMATKTDLLTLTTTIQDALRAEMAGIRTEVTAHGTRIEALETAMETQSSRISSTDLAITRQGDMLLDMRRHLEDLDNRGRRCNIRVRGVPETAGGENATEVLSGLFKMLLQEEAPECFEFERAHRAARPRSIEDGPRDLICCLHSFPVKELIMRKARERPEWTYRNSQVSLYNDLSPLTLEARRALKPVTTALRDRHIDYKWGFPFALLARHQDSWISARWPAEIPRFLETLDLPPIQITNWVLGPAGQGPRPQRAPRRRRDGSPQRRPPRRRMEQGGQDDLTSLSPPPSPTVRDTIVCMPSHREAPSLYAVSYAHGMKIYRKWERDDQCSVPTDATKEGIKVFWSNR